MGAREIGAWFYLAREGGDFTEGRVMQNIIIKEELQHAINFLRGYLDVCTHRGYVRDLQRNRVQKQYLIPVRNVPTLSEACGKSC